MNRDRHELALDVARRAAAHTLTRFRDPSLRVAQKLDRTVVTEADRDAEALLRREIEARFPEDTIVGEELGTKEGTSGWAWYLDPIDGTQAYARGVPLFGTLVGVTHEGRSEIGVIALPALGELVHAARGSGCLWLPSAGSSTAVPARVSTCAALGEAMFLTTWMQSFQMIGRVELFSRLTENTGVFRGWGDCYGYALVATGRAEIMVDPVLAPWDAGPMPVILEEAGGRYTSFAGTVDIHAASGVATNGLLHDAVLALLK
jgi:histidinol phosphatase-like enzyme (inositol monophosphatase family)